MFLQQISVGATPDDGTGTPLRNGGLLINEGFARLAGSPWRLPVQSIVSSAPSSPSHLARYLVSATPVGSFSTHANTIAEWIATPAGGLPVNAWQFEPATAGAMVWVVDEQRFRRFGGGSWDPFESSDGAVTYQGTWNAATNSPTIPPAASSNKGDYRRVAVAGTSNVDGIASWNIGDWIISDGTRWDRLDTSSPVQSVFGLQGIVSVPSLPQLSGAAEDGDQIVLYDTSTGTHVRALRSQLVNAGSGITGVAAAVGGGLRASATSGTATIDLDSGNFAALLNSSAVQNGNFAIIGFDAAPNTVVPRLLPLKEIYSRATTISAVAGTSLVMTSTGSALQASSVDSLFTGRSIVSPDLRGYVETVQDQSIAGNTTLGSYDLGNVYDLTLNANATVTLPAVPAGKGASITVIATQDNIGGRSLSFAAPAGQTLKILGAASLAPVASGALKTSLYGFYKLPNRTFWVAEFLGSES